MIVYETLTAWPGGLPRSPDDREFSPFTADWRDTVEVLEREAQALGAEWVTIRLALPPSAIRRDGALAADRKPPEHPGVVVVLNRPGVGALTFHTDRYKARGYTGSGPKESWRHNVRAVALGLEALRKVERYGIADAGQQFAGYRELGTGTAMSAIPAPLTLDQAAAILADAVGTPPGRVLGSAPAAKAAYREALKLLHPDHGGSGDGERMARLQEAWTLVKAHHDGSDR